MYSGLTFVILGLDPRIPCGVVGAIGSGVLCCSWDPRVKPEDDD
jgi:hypothetical protein